MLIESLSKSSMNLSPSRPSSVDNDDDDDDVGPQAATIASNGTAGVTKSVAAIASNGCVHDPGSKIGPVKLRNLLNGEQFVDSLHAKSSKLNTKSHGCTALRCTGSLMNPAPVEARVRSIEETFEQAKEFIDNYYASIKRLDSAAHRARLEEIRSELEARQTYDLTQTELVYGAKLAWRNASRCIGRIQWSKLQVFDVRTATSASEMFEALCNHIAYATNGGRIRSAITIFPQRSKSPRADWRIWNSQLIGYAGYREPSTGKVLGDPANADFTEICLRLGWRQHSDDEATKKRKRTRFDVLPLVVSAGGGPPQLFEIPDELVMRVKLKHPRLSNFEELGLEWYALPAVANMMLDVGGLQFTAAPFSGWYMVTEIGARDLADTNRYNLLEEVALKMGLSTASNASLWKDRALLELNVAVLDSFQAAGVTIVDHHTASETFMTHLANEQRLRGGCPADWVWLVPPTSGSATQVFHQELVNYHLLPNYEYMEPSWKSYDWRRHAAARRLSKEPLLSDVVDLEKAPESIWTTPTTPVAAKLATGGGVRKRGFREIARAVKFTLKLFGQARAKRLKATILYATETGRSERYARRLAQTFSYAFNVELTSMSDYEFASLEHETLLLIVTSTFGNGDPPENGELFAKHLAAVKLTGDATPGVESINSVQTNPFFQMISEIEHQEQTSNGEQKQDRRHLGQLRPLSNVRFSVFALGSTAYPHFCAFGRYVDQTLGELGAEQILKCALADELGGQEKLFNEWSFDVFKKACEVFCLTDSIGPIDDRPQIVWTPSDVKFVSATDTVVIDAAPESNGNQATTNGHISSETTRLDTFGELQPVGDPKIVRNLTGTTNKQIIPFRVVKRVDLHNYFVEDNLQTIRIDLESEHLLPSASREEGSESSSQAIVCEPGDHIALYPINRPENVQKILNIMRGSADSAAIDFDQPYTILVRSENLDLTPASYLAGAQGHKQPWVVHDLLPAQMSIREALMRYLDITSPPNQEFLLILSRQATLASERKRLQQLAKNSSLYEEWKSKTVPTLLSLLDEFKSIRFEPALITQIPLLKPRYYSLSGSISLTVGVVKFTTSTGLLREGLCSNYLNTVDIHDPQSTIVYGYVRSAPAFHLPTDKSIPIILISAGTGIAPFRSFWQQRHSEVFGLTSRRQSLKKLSKNGTLSNGNNGHSDTFGRIEMYFGCRNSNYILYKDELDEMYACGVLSSLEIAFSRPIDSDVIDEVPKDRDTPHRMTNGSVTGSKLGKISKVASIKQARKRVYVQDKLREHGEHLFQLIMKHGAHIYVCGDVAMADGVCKTLASIINEANKLNCQNGTSQIGASNEITSNTLSPATDDGETVMMSLRNLNRYHEDIFSAKQMS